MKQPLVSIVVNVYNGERYLGECLDSILSLEGSFPLQIIITDDASTDSTADIICSYEDPRFEIVRFQRNVGAAAAINSAFSLVRGEFIARIDYDDCYHPEFLIRSLAVLNECPEAAFVCSSVRLIDPEGIPTGTASPEDYGEVPGLRDRFTSMLVHHFVTAPTILGRAEHWRRATPIPVGMNFCDWYMNLTMAETAPVFVLDRITADYRVHPQGMHSKYVRDGMGERVTLEVLQRFIDESPRAAELAPHAASIRAGHYVDWGNKYFGQEMNSDALRCYRAALALAPSLAWRGRFLHRMIGLMAGRDTYERIKRLAKSAGRRF